MRRVAPQPVMIGNDVRFWPKADIGECTAYVRFRG
jgi:hypothetical protein